MLLNFGHTFGHAIEAPQIIACHTGSVGLGMLMAFDVAQKLGIGPTPNTNRFASAEYIKELLDVWPNKSHVESWLDPQLALNAFENDKKHSNDNYALILPNSDSRLDKVSLKRDEPNKNMIFQTFKKIGSLI